MKLGDKVKMWVDNSKFKGNEESYYAYGEVTIIRDRRVKIIFIEDLDYAYYDRDKLIPVTEQEYREHERTQSERSS